MFHCGFIALIGTGKFITIFEGIETIVWGDEYYAEVYWDVCDPSDLNWQKELSQCNCILHPANGPYFGIYAPQ